MRWERLVEHMWVKHIEDHKLNLHRELQSSTTPDASVCTLPLITLESVDGELVFDKYAFRKELPVLIG
jgi:hypothetical protein